ncbi:lysozyme inhibitor LprI family protein [Sphingomonas sp. Tas61C01]|uniref:lysozyme inhibitor LprI family protein n=1 Tax=Sphingomonas sp. Tas61C01 TaxID=3458297 RepID=UPI00403E436B
MILPVMLMLQAADAARESTPSEIDLCSESDQGLRFCLADKLHARAEHAMDIALASARRSATVQKREIADFSTKNGGVTLSGDPVRALVASQSAWERSYRADCLVVGLGVATGNAGTEGVTSNLNCEANRILDRVAFLNQTYSTER